MIKQTPSLGRIIAMIAFTLSVFAILAFGGTVPLKPEGYRFTVHMPEAATLAEEADVRMAGVNIGKVKSKELDKGGARTIVEVQLDNAYAPIPKDTNAILRQNRKKDVRQRFVQPTRARPLRVLVTGDSQAEFLGQRLVDQGPSGLLDVTTVARNGTGLTNPAFFNWEVNARQEIETRDLDAVVMAIGDNDGFNVQTPDGSLYDPGEPGWETEFARRVAVVSSVLSSGGKRPVYWVPPPTARDPKFNRIFRIQNRAVERATRAVPALRYVDVYSTLSRGRYND